MNIISRKDAKLKQLRHYYTGNPCKYGHMAERLTSTGQCCECVRLNHHKYYPNNRRKRLQEIKSWSQRNKEAVNEATQKWRETHPDAAVQTAKDYYERTKDLKLAYNSQWRRDNPGKVISYNAARRAQTLQATTAWTNTNDIQQVYDRCQELSKRTGTLHHVDHIIPLVNEQVCGLHVLDNLQIIPATENCSKGNKLLNP